MNELPKTIVYQILIKGPKKQANFSSYKLIFRLLKLIFEPIKTFFLKTIALKIIIKNCLLNNQKQFEKMHLFYHYCHGNFEHVKFLALCWQIAIVGGLIWGHKLLKSKSLVVVKLYFQIKIPHPPFFKVNLDWSILHS